MSTNSETYSSIDRLSSKAKRSFGASNESAALTSIVILSGILSALFFWQFAANVFGQLWPPAAILLGLAVGLMPSEGAYFGWKNIRASKTNLTNKQLKATKSGLVIAVATAVFSTFSLFVVTVPFVPTVIREYGDWFVFIALSLPILIQFSIIAYYELNSQSTTENYKNAELDALGFSAFIKFETARKMAIVESAARHLELQLDQYADGMGAQEVANILAGNSTKSIGQQPTTVHAATPPAPALDKSAPQTRHSATSDFEITDDNKRYTFTLSDGTQPYLSQDDLQTIEVLAQTSANLSGKSATVQDREGEIANRVFHPNA